MKKIASVLSLTFFVLCAVEAQPKPTMLSVPANWQFEQFSLPPQFAPTVKYHGMEELRFSPGWDKKEANDYFTVIWSFRFDDTKEISEDEIKNYLLTYFKGLCGSTAASRHLTGVDTSAIRVATGKKPGTGKSLIYEVSLHIFGVFADGSPVTLNLEIKEINDEVHQKVYLLMVGSPQPRTNPVWQDLYRVQREFVLPG